MTHERTKKRWLDALVPPPILMGATGLLMWVVGRFSPHFHLSPLMGWTLPLSLAALSVGIVFAGVLGFRKAATTIDPTRPDSASKLVTSGIYRYTRNPMYLGFAGVLLAWGLYLQAWWSLPLPLVFVLYISVFQVRPEEDALMSKFEERFATYIAKVRRWL